MEIVFYKRAIPADLEHGAYDSPLFSVSIPDDWRGTKAEGFKYARKLFKEHFNCSDAEFGAFHRFE
jgi:hypothetical protein